jgi:hypothetical protein
MTILSVLILGNQAIRARHDLLSPEGTWLEIRGDNLSDYYSGVLPRTSIPYFKSARSATLATTATRLNTEALVIFDNRGLGLELARDLRPEIRSRTLIVLPAGQEPQAGYLEMGFEHFGTTTQLEGDYSIRDFLREVADGTIA